MIYVQQTDPNAKRKVFVMPFESMAKREFDMLSNDYYKDNQQKQERDFQTAVVKVCIKYSNPVTFLLYVHSSYFFHRFRVPANPPPGIPCSRSTGIRTWIRNAVSPSIKPSKPSDNCMLIENRPSFTKHHSDCMILQVRYLLFQNVDFICVVPIILIQFCAKLFVFCCCCIQDVIKDPEAYATQQIVWNQQHQTFLNKYSRSGQIKSVCDGADALQEERYRNRFREERVARSTEYVLFCLFCSIL
jgi:hypothetical protein